MSATHLLLVVLVLIAECLALFFGQRRLFWMTVDATGSKLLAYFLAVPGTVLHESSHYILCLILGVPAGADVVDAKGKRGHVSFFFPHKDEDGGVTLGSVPHAATDPLRGALIAVAPLLLVPPLLAGLSLALLGSHALSSPWHAFMHAPVWAKALWCYAAFSCGQAAFPSPGDHIGALGAVALAVLGGAVIYGLYASGGISGVGSPLQAVMGLLAFPAAAAAAGLAVMKLLLLVRVLPQERGQ